MKKCLFLLSLLLFALSCEQNETIVIDDGQTFCPLNFRYESNILFTGDCPNTSSNLYVPQLTTDNQGFIFSQNLYDGNTPFFSWIDSTEEYKAYHLLENGTSVSFHFDAIDLQPGTKIALFATATTQLPDGIYFDFFKASDEKNHYAQVFVQRNPDSTYLLGANVKGAIQPLTFTPNELDGAILQIIRKENGDLAMQISYKSGIVTIGFLNDVSANTLSDIFTTLPAVGIGIYSTSHSCDLRTVRFRPRLYEYKNSLKPALDKKDNFECNSIWIK